MVIIATRTILGKSYARSTKTQGIRPRSRTLTAVQDAMLEVISVFSCPPPQLFMFPAGVDFLLGRDAISTLWL